MSDTIEVKLNAPALTPEKLIEVVKHFFAIVRGVSKNVCGSHAAPKWTVEVAYGSAIIRARNPSPTAEASKSIAIIQRGLSSIRGGSRSLPYGFTIDEIRAVGSLASLIDQNGIVGIAVQNGGAPEVLTREIVPTIDAILNEEKHIAWGSIEGEMNSMSAKHGFQCTVKDEMYECEVICYFQKDDVVDEAVKGFRKRVLVSGLIRYSMAGNPDNMVVSSVRVFPPENELPTSDEIQEICRS